MANEFLSSGPVRSQKKGLSALLIVAVLLLMVALVLGATRDDRGRSAQYTVARYQFAQQSWAAAVSATTEPVLLDVSGKCEQIEVVVNNNTNNVTATVTITSQNSGTLFTQAAIAENATTVYKATSDSTDFDAFLINGNLTAAITPSGVPGASGLTVDVILYLR